MRGSRSRADARDAAFARFYREQYAGLVSFFLRRIDDRELARDLAAEAFRIAWTRWGEGPANRAWLYGVGRNLVGDEWRRRARAGAIGELPDLDANDRSEHAVDVRLVLATLPDRHREVLALTYWDGLAAAEVGEVLGISTVNVWARLHRARRAFATAWQGTPAPKSATTTAEEAS